MNSKSLHRPSAAPTEAARIPPAAPVLAPRISTASLFGTARELQIEHSGALYRLRITRQDKLILTK